MHSASPQGAAAPAALKPRSAPIALSINVKCRRRGGAEIPIEDAATKMFQHGNMSCGMCADDNGGQFPCRPGKS